MYRYPDGTFKIIPPAKVDYEGYWRNFSDLTVQQRDEIGYNEAVPIVREPFTTYETEWEKGTDLIYRETIISSVIDTDARDAFNAEHARIERDRLLLNSDVTQLDDSPLTPECKYQWQVYRQSLRDIPKQVGFPNEITWPIQPEKSTDTDLQTVKNSDAIASLNKEETLNEIQNLVNTLDEGTEKETFLSLLKILGG